METYHGHVRTPADAIILFEACRIGLLPRVQRRLSEKERQSIKSGSVFVWDEREAGMRRWTDGKSWSASRVSGSFLTYREMEGKRGGSHAAQASRAGKTPDSTRGSDEDGGEGGEEGPDGYRYKPDGLMKQSFSITTSTGQHLHLISYYARSHPTVPGLNQPSTDPSLRHIQPQKGLYPESSVNDQQNLPVVTRGPMAGTAFSVPPPVQHYARPAAAHPHGYSPNTYNWPVAHPPPMNGQPHPAQPGYPPGSYLPPLSGASGPPQYQYAHPQHPQHPLPPKPQFSPLSESTSTDERAQQSVKKRIDLGCPFSDIKFLDLTGLQDSEIEACNDPACVVEDDASKQAPRSGSFARSPISLDFSAPAPAPFECLRILPAVC